MKSDLVRQSIRDGRKVIEYQVQPGELMDGMVLKSCKEGSVSGVLPMGAVYENQHNYMYAYIDQKESLKNHFPDVMVKKDILRIFENIAGTLEQLVEAGVNLAYIVLDTDYIFIDDATGCACLVCMPGRNAEGTIEDIAEFFRAILAHGVYSDKEDGAYVAKLLSLLNRDFALKSFLQYIQELTKEEEVELVAEPVAEPETEPVAEPETESVAEPETESVAEPETESVAEPEAESLPITEAVIEPTPIVEPVSTGVVPEVPMHGPRPMYMPEDVGIQPQPVVIQPVQPVQDVQPVVVQPVQPVPSVQPMEVQSQQKPTPHLIRVKTGEYILLSEEVFVIGKSAANVNYTIMDNPAVSRIHCTIYKKNGAYYVRDEKSTNSTYVNGEQVIPGNDHLLTNNCKLYLGDEEFTYLLW